MQTKNKKFKFYHQLESVDCGPACLAMVARYHGKNYSIKQIKSICSITRMGVSVHDIINGAKRIGFNAVGAKLALEQIEQVDFPTILFWKQDHFVVLYKIKKTKDGFIYYLADPGYGKIKIDQEVLIKEWMGNNMKGIAIIIENNLENPIPELPQIKAEPFFKSESVKFIFSFLTKNSSKYFLSSLLLIIGLVANWTMPTLFRWTVDKGIGQKSLNIVFLLLLGQFGVFLGSFLSKLFSDLILTKLNFNLSIAMKENFLHKLMRLPVNYFDTRMNSDTLQRLGDQNKIQNFITWKGLEFILNILNIIVFSFLLVRINLLLFFIFLIISVASIIWVSFFLRLRNILEYSLFLRQSENSNSIYEFIMNMPEIKVNNAHYKMISKLSGIQKKLNVLELRSLFLNMYQLLGVSFLSKFRELIAIAICGFLIIKGNMTVGTLLSVSYILGQLSYPIQSLVNYLQDGQDASISQKRINDVFSETNENIGEKQQVPDYIEDIRINNLSFKYPGTFSPMVLKNINFTIPKNEITAIVGSSGSGKTTLLKLLLSYYNPSEGKINLDNTNLANINSEEWRKSCGAVLQDGHIFAGTIAENIAIADENIDQSRIIEAAQVACIHDFINGLPMGYNTKVGSVGIQLSGGQTQRLLIARAVYKNSNFLFFDEATSSLDANNEKQIMENLNTFFKGKTVVIIAHRLSTVKNADNIIVLSNGELVEQGSHIDLVDLRGGYFNLVKNQLELGN